jgi:hypothetical protein
VDFLLFEVVLVVLAWVCSCAVMWGLWLLLRILERVSTIEHNTRLALDLAIREAGQRIWGPCDDEAEEEG